MPRPTAEQIHAEFEAQDYRDVERLVCEWSGATDALLVIDGDVWLNGPETRWLREEDLVAFWGWCDRRGERG